MPTVSVVPQSMFRVQSSPTPSPEHSRLSTVHYIDSFLVDVSYQYTCVSCIHKDYSSYHCFYFITTDLMLLSYEVD